MTNSTPIEELSANVLNTRYENFDQETLDNAGLRMMDVIGCLIGGANADGNLALTNLVKDWGGKKESTICIYGGKAPAHNTAMLNSIFARSFDFEALIPVVDGQTIPSHISGTTVMTALTMTEMSGVDGKELITALLVGDDLAVRILASTGFRITSGWDNTGTINTIGATAIAGRLLGLDQKQMRNAFGIVLNQLGGSFQCIWDGATSFKLHQGLSARNGIISAQLAKAGWTGPEDLLFSRFGYYKLYTEGCVNPEILTRGLGEKYYWESVFKPYPCCRAVQPTIDCALTLVRKHDIWAEDIQEVVIIVPQEAAESFLGQPFKIGDFPHGNAAFSYRYTVATALLRRKVMPEHFSLRSMTDPNIDSIMNKIRLEGRSGEPTLNARLDIKMKDGKEFTESTDTPKGDPTNPMSKDEIISKFMANVDFSKRVSRTNAEKIIDMVDNMEKQDSVKPLISLLVP